MNHDQDQSQHDLMREALGACSHIAIGAATAMCVWFISLPKVIDDLNRRERALSLVAWLSLSEAIGDTVVFDEDESPAGYLDAGPVLQEDGGIAGVSLNFGPFSPQGGDQIIKKRFEVEPKYFDSALLRVHLQPPSLSSNAEGHEYRVYSVMAESDHLPAQGYQLVTKDTTPVYLGPRVAWNVRLLTRGHYLAQPITSRPHDFGRIQSDLQALGAKVTMSSYNDPEVHGYLAGIEEGRHEILGLSLPTPVFFGSAGIFLFLFAFALWGPLSILHMNYATSGLTSWTLSAGVGGAWRDAFEGALLLVSTAFTLSPIGIILIIQTQDFALFGEERLLIAISEAGLVVAAVTFGYLAYALAKIRRRVPLTEAALAPSFSAAGAERQG